MSVLNVGERVTVAHVIARGWKFESRHRASRSIKYKSPNGAHSVVFVNGGVYGVVSNA